MDTDDNGELPSGLIIKKSLSVEEIVVNYIQTVLILIMLQINGCLMVGANQQRTPVTWNRQAWVEEIQEMVRHEAEKARW